MACTFHRPAVKVGNIPIHAQRIGGQAHPSSATDSAMSLIGSSTEPNWKKEVALIATAIRENSPLIAAGVVFLTSASIYNFSNSEKVAINVMSAELVASIPLYFSIITLLVILLSFSLGMTSMVTLEGAARDQRGRLLAVPIVPTGRGEFMTAPVRRAALVAAGAWLLAYWSPALIFIGLGLITVALDGEDASYVVMILLGLAMSIVAMSWLSLRIRRPHRNRAVGKSRSTLLLAGVVQSILMMTAIVIAIRYYSEQGYGDWGIAAWTLTVTALLAGLQFVAALAIARTSSHGGVLRQCVIGGAVLVTLVCLVPTTSVFVSRWVFNISTTGPVSCVQLALPPGYSANIMTDAVGAAPSASAPSSWTQPLRVIAPYDDTVQVRLRDIPDTVFRIKKADIQAVRVCPSRQ